MRPRLREVTESFLYAMEYGGPITPAQKLDFGLDTNLHTYALYHSVQNGHISPEQLDDALGHGPMLTELVRCDPTNPFKGIRFTTSWDAIYGRDPEIDPEPLAPEPTYEMDRDEAIEPDDD